MIAMTAVQVLFNSKKKNRAKRLINVVLAVIIAIAEIVAVLILEEKLMVTLSRLEALGVDYTVKIVLIFLYHLGYATFINLVLYGLYFVLRMACRIITMILQSRLFAFQTYAENFYEYDNDYDQWFIKEKWINLRRMFKWFTIISPFVVGLSLGLTRYLLVNKEIALLIFPAMAHFVIVEFFCFINGMTKQEYIHDIGGDDSYAQRISNFYKVREVYEKILPREILTSHTGCEYIAAQSTVDLLEALRTGDREESIVSHFFMTNENNEKLDNDCILATKDLMKGQNVIFFNPFYRDLGKYLVLPIMSVLLKGKNCLIIVGRNSAREDIKVWMDELLWETSKIKSMWRTKDLNLQKPECEVGVLGFSQLYDEGILEANKEFLQQVKFVLMLEPSLMLNTGQVGLSILSQQMENYSDKPAYCMLDRMVDGLVDTMSHLLQSEITQVVAPPVSRNLHTGMCWDADGDYLRQRLFGKQTRFLGNGTELAAIAIKNQISEVSWFSERKAPVRDIQWIAGQYFPTLCQYMNLPIQQQSINDKIKFISNFWSVPEENEQFLIAEDEFVNMFSTMRTFLSRGKNQTFVNVISENYLLRDYMRCNSKLFMSNPNAIPSMVPDYAKTERNTLIKLLLMMSYNPVSETAIRDEFNLLGIETDDVLHILNILLSKYTKADSTIFNVKTETFDSDGINLRDENFFSVSPEKFEEFFGEDLKNAYYICEEEKAESEFIDAKLFGHVTQTILPGQMVTYDGKYYVADHVTSTSGVILRRASNLYDGRRYYRQLRKYVFGERSLGEVISSIKTMDIEVTKLRADFKVTTSGYLQMDRNNDLRTARLVDFTNDPSVETFTREYHNKTILRVKLPETNLNLRFTISMLLSEMMRSIFPEGWPYLAVLCEMPEDTEGMLNHILYANEGIDPEYIYIVEDSTLDLGLIEAIDKNLIFFMEIITDFVNWHFEKLHEPPAEDPVTNTVEFPPADFKKRGLFSKLAKRIKQLFGGKKEEDVNIGSVSSVEEKKREKPEKKRRWGRKGKEKPEEVQPAPVEQEEIQATNDSPVDFLESSGAETQTEETEKVEKPQVEMFTPNDAEVEKSNAGFEEEDVDISSEIVAIDGTDIFDEDSNPDDEEYFEECFEELGIVPTTKSRYQEECYLKFGFEEIDKRIQLDETRKYLQVRGFSNNSLTKARHRDGLEPTLIDLEAVNFCDFCGLPLTGVAYERLTDGRIRCNDCSATAIRSVEDFKRIFFQSVDMMQNFYGIEFRKPLNVRTTDAKTVAKNAGSVFEPTTEADGRVLGFAQKKGDTFTLMIENGSPRLATIDTMVHELTHIWQYLNWDKRQIKRIYEEDWKVDAVYEGMAVWSSIQYLYLIGETSYAIQQEILSANREDIYGIGFRLFREKYPLIKDSSLICHSPFTVFPPL